MTVTGRSKEFSTDVAIIGAGPVGLFAVFECGMLGMSCRVIDALEDIGGQCTALYPEKPIFDIPGQPEISGAELVRSLEAQIAPFDPHVHLNQQVIELDGEPGAFSLTTSAGNIIYAKVIIVAAGVGAFGPKHPPLENIEDFERAGPGLGVKYMVREMKDFAGKRVVIAGGGDSAVDWAVQLSSIAAKIHVVHRRAKFRAMDESVRRLNVLVDDGIIELVTPYQLERLEKVIMVCYRVSWLRNSMVVNEPSMPMYCCLSMDCRKAWARYTNGAWVIRARASLCSQRLQRHQGQVFMRLAMLQHTLVN